MRGQDGAGMSTTWTARRVVESMCSGSMGRATPRTPEESVRMRRVADAVPYKKEIRMAAKDTNGRGEVEYNWQRKRRLDRQKAAAYQERLDTIRGIAMFRRAARGEDNE